MFMKGGGVTKVLWKGIPKEGTTDKDVLTCTHFGSLKDIYIVVIIDLIMNVSKYLNG